MHLRCLIEHMKQLKNFLFLCFFLQIFHNLSIVKILDQYLIPSTSVGESKIVIFVDEERLLLHLHMAENVYFLDKVLLYCFADWLEELWHIWSQRKEKVNRDVGA